MTPDERQLLSGLFDRIRAAPAGPMDREADAFIQDAMRSVPSAGYVLSQTVLVQQHALEAAAKRISELEAQAQSAPAAQPEGSFLGNIGRSLFGGAPQPSGGPAPGRAYDARGYERDAAPPPQYAQRQAYAPPPPQAGPWGAPPPASGGGFLHGAMQTATGVAGGVLLGNALGGLFGGHGGGLFGGGFAGGGGAPHETINNYYEAADPAGQHAQDVLQDMDQDQDDAQDAADDGGGGDDYA